MITTFLDSLCRTILISTRSIFPNGSANFYESKRDLNPWKSQVYQAAFTDNSYAQNMRNQWELKFNNRKKVQESDPFEHISFRLINCAIYGIANCQVMSEASAYLFSKYAVENALSFKINMIKWKDPFDHVYLKIEVGAFLIVFDPWEQYYHISLSHDLNEHLYLEKMKWIYFNRLAISMPGENHLRFPAKKRELLPKILSSHPEEECFFEHASLLEQRLFVNFIDNRISEHLKNDASSVPLYRIKNIFFKVPNQQINMLLQNM